MSFLTRFERWDPFDELNSMRNRMDRVLARMSPGDEELLTGQWAPLTDIIETKDAILLQAELPGMKEKDFTIEVEDNVLTVQGERHLEEKKEEKGFQRIERSYGKFLRTFTLPPNADSTAIKATFHDGVLEVTVPKKAETKPRRIDIGVTPPKDEKRKISAA